MKYFLLLMPSFLLSCSTQNADVDAKKFAPDTVHVTDGIHVKLLDLNLLRDRVLQAQFQKKKVVEKDYSKGIHSFAGHGVDLGMEGVPVLDQGQYGTCVTFSTTAALDALIGRGDLISQQCSLELDTALGDNWWDGAYYPSQIIDPLEKYGIVEKAKCDNKYPVPYAKISLSAYQALVDKSASEVVASVEYEYMPKNSIADVKKALDSGRRVLTGFQLQNVSLAVRGFDIKVDGKQYQGGLWACKQGGSSNYCSSSNAGHEVIIIGYDDDQELLKIRNSWTSSVGDNGNYYMTYAYFTAMAMDQTSVW